MSATFVSVRVLSVAAVLSIGAAHAGHAQAAAKPKHPPVCAKGVRIYTDKAQVPVPNDTLTMPPSDGPIRVTSPEEAEAAELALRGRAGSVGATGILVADQVEDDGGNQRLRRSVTAFFSPADSARSQQACK